MSINIQQFKSFMKVDSYLNDEMDFDFDIIKIKVVGNKLFWIWYDKDDESEPYNISKYYIEQGTKKMLHTYAVLFTTDKKDEAIRELNKMK